MNLQRTHPSRASGWDWRAALAAGGLASEAGDEQRAAARFQEAVRLAEEADSTFGLLESLNSLGVSLARLEKLAEAEAVLRKAVTAARSGTLGIEATSKSIGNLAEVISREGRLEEAAELFREVLALTASNGDPVARGAVHNNLGLLLARQGHDSEAVEQFREALRVLDRSHSPVEWATTQNNLGLILLGLGQPDPGITLLRDSLKTIRDARGETHPLTIKSLAGLGQALRSVGKEEDGLRLIQDAISISERILGPDHPQTKGLRADLDPV